MRFFLLTTTAAVLLFTSAAISTISAVQHDRIKVIFRHEYTEEDDQVPEQVEVEPLRVKEEVGAPADIDIDQGIKYFVSNSVDDDDHGDLTMAEAEIKPKAVTGFVINTWNFIAATEKAWTSLTQNKTALDAVEIGCTECEVLQCDNTVGFGGSPDENGETTLDALIMDGQTHSIGAVGCLRRIKPAISVARKVMEHTKHSILVGELATAFALQMGFAEENLTTPVSAQMHADWKNASCQPNFWRNVSPDPNQHCGPYNIDRNRGGPSKSVADFGRKIDRFNHDTIGMVVVDESRAVASGTSSNGARNKIPGRVGDAAIVGAGTYSAKDVGGAAATGDGDVMMRFLPSMVAVEQMRMGRTPTQAAEYAIRRIAEVYPNFSGAIVALNVRGEPGAACHGMERFPYSFRNATLPYAQEVWVNCI